MDNGVQLFRDLVFLVLGLLMLLERFLMLLETRTGQFKSRCTVPPMGRVGGPKRHRPEQAAVEQQGGASSPLVTVADEHEKRTAEPVTVSRTKYTTNTRLETKTHLLSLMLRLLRLLKLFRSLLDQALVVLGFLLHQFFFLLNGIAGTEETHVV
jgi:hypothetical protein